MLQWIANQCRIVEDDVLSFIGAIRAACYPLPQSAKDKIDEVTRAEQILRDCIKESNKWKDR